RAELEAFADAVAARQPFLVSPEQMVNGIAVLESIEKSSARGRPVEIKPEFRRHSRAGGNPAFRSSRGLPRSAEIARRHAAEAGKGGGHFPRRRDPCRPASFPRRRESRMRRRPPDSQCPDRRLHGKNGLWRCASALLHFAAFMSRRTTFMRWTVSPARCVQ